MKVRHIFMRTDLYQDLYQKEDSYWWMVGRRKFVNTLLEQSIESGHNLKILDVGCGSGRGMEEFKKYGEVFGFDISPEALDFCRQRGLKNVQLADLNQKLPYDDNSFDLVVALDVLEHVEKDVFALSEIKRILKENGRFLLSVPAHPKLWSYWDEIIYHKRRYTQNELKGKLENAGFVIKRLTYAHLFIFLPTILARIVRSSVFTKKAKPATSDFVALPKLLNKFMIGLYSIEDFLFEKFNMPFGLSLMAVSKKET